tara:strand:- start:164 stop:568 length:405 start_codon:yes stop_codon:yes gene_type:complete
MATTRFRGPVLQGKFNEAGLTGFNLEQKTSAYSVLIGDSGKTFTSPSGSITFTLPAVAANEGSVFTFVNTGSDGSNGMVITGAAGTEYITYKGVVNQITLTNTKATSKVGDFVKIGGQLAGATWTVLDIQGIWA